LLQTEKYKEIQPMMMTTYEKGVAKGLEQGVAKGLESARRMLQGLLARRFGPLNETTVETINSLPPERLEQIGMVLLDAKSLEELGLPK
jgi:flagellar biosynthesis/type III secretory pathway protein FliH